MIEISDRALGQVIDIAPLPPFADARDILRDSLPLLDAPSRVLPIEAAASHVRVEMRGVWQNFDPDVTPQMVEPVNTSQSRLYKGGAFVGPSQSGKTMALITTAMHPVLCDPAPVLVVHMDRPSRDRWVEESLNPVIQNSPELRTRLGKARDDDTFGRKRFRGMRLAIGYPTAQWLSSAKYRLVALTDFDHFPPELGVRADAPEGSAFDMSMQRVKTYLSRGFVFAESTPAWPVLDPTWTAKADHPHEMPPVRHGIVRLYNRGTRGRWYWSCRDCDEMFEPRFELLNFDETLPPMEAGESAEMACPHCGSLIGAQHKNEFNRMAMDGRGGWLHEAESGGGLVCLGDDAVRQTEVASWALDGAAATFSNWSELVARSIEAQRQVDELDDDLALGRFYYTDLGRPYSRTIDADDDELSVATLKEDRLDHKKGTAPEWVRFITVSADVQKYRFPVQVTGWGVDGTRTVIDRFDLFTPPPKNGAPADRALRPAKYPGDWDVLIELEDRRWRVEGTEFELRAFALGVDFQGEPGVSDNAEDFWKRRVKAGLGKRWFLTRGIPGRQLRDRIWYATPERSNKKGGQARSIKLLNMSTDRLKDSVAAALMRPMGTPRAFPLPEFLEEEPLAEFCAEMRTDKGWEKKPGQVRNESFDLSVQAQALVEHKGLRRMNKDAPWNWALLGDENPHCFRVSEEQSAASQKPAKRKRRIGKMRI